MVNIFKNSDFRNRGGVLYHKDGNDDGVGAEPGEGVVRDALDGPNNQKQVHQQLNIHKLE